MRIFPDITKRETLLLIFFHPAEREDKNERRKCIHRNRNVIQSYVIRRWPRLDRLGSLILSRATPFVGLFKQTYVEHNIKTNELHPLDTHIPIAIQCIIPLLQALKLMNLQFSV